MLGDLIEIEDTRHNEIKIVSKHNINTEYIYNSINLMKEFMILGIVLYVIVIMKE